MYPVAAGYIVLVPRINKIVELNIFLNSLFEIHQAVLPNNHIIGCAVNEHHFTFQIFNVI